jgi:hypothetical protein
MLTDVMLQPKPSCADDSEPDVLSVAEARRHILSEITPI